MAALDLVMSLGSKVRFVSSAFTLKDQKNLQPSNIQQRQSSDTFIIGSSSGPGEQCEHIGFANVFYVVVFCFGFFISCAKLLSVCNF